MKRVRNFLKTTLLGGIVVILPSTILLAVLAWMFGRLLDFMRPLSELLQTKVGLQEVLAHLAAMTVLVAGCFFIGLAVRTRIGKWAFNLVETKVLSRVPTYTLVRETVLQFSGEKKFPFSAVAMVKLYGSEALTTGFIMNEHESGYQTVFIPTGPNPTSGMIYHLPGNNVYPIKVDVRETMRVIFNCGGGADKLLDSFVESRVESQRDALCEKE